MQSCNCDILHVLVYLYTCTALVLDKKYENPMSQGSHHKLIHNKKRKTQKRKCEKMGENMDMMLEAKEMGTFSGLEKWVPRLFNCNMSSFWIFVSPNFGLLF